MPPKSASRPAAAPAVPVPVQPVPAWLFPTVAALTLLALFSMFTAPVTDNDTWFHLRTGAYIVQNHKLPDPDPFSWTTYLGKPTYAGEAATRDLNLKHEWGAQVILYLVYAAGGFPGMVLFRACCLTFFCGMVGWVVWRRTGRFYLSVAAAMAAGMIARSAAVDRPYLVTYALMALTLWILERRRPLWLLPPLFIFWANAHGGYFMGWVLLGGYCGEALFRRLRGAAAKRRKDSLGSQPAGDSGERAESHLLQRDPRHVRLPAKHPAAQSEGVARAWAMAAELVQRPAGGRGSRAVVGVASREALGHPAVRRLRERFP